MSIWKAKKTQSLTNDDDESIPDSTSVSEQPKNK